MVMIRSQFPDLSGSTALPGLRRKKMPRRGKSAGRGKRPTLRGRALAATRGRGKKKGLRRRASAVTATTRRPARRKTTNAPTGGRISGTAVTELQRARLLQQQR
jgi:hypothetical protein